jgi:hypothetical protein
VEALRSTLAAVAVILLTAACGDHQDDEGARALLARVRADGYRTWDRAPGYEERRESSAPHAGAVDIYVNDRVTEILAFAEPSELWPKGATLVKDGFSGSSLALIAIMEKRTDGWYWAEYDAAGEPDYAGRPAICTDCHQRGSDYVRAFTLPR